LAEAGAVVFRKTAAAVSYVVGRLRPTVHEQFLSIPLEDFQGQFAGINVGVESFYESLKSQGARAIHVDWRPPAGGNEQLMAILAKMRGQ